MDQLLITSSKEGKIYALHRIILKCISFVHGYMPDVAYFSPVVAYFSPVVAYLLLWHTMPQQAIHLHVIFVSTNECDVTSGIFNDSLKQTFVSRKIHTS